MRNGSNFALFAYKRKKFKRNGLTPDDMLDRLGQDCTVEAKGQAFLMRPDKCRGSCLTNGPEDRCHRSYYPMGWQIGGVDTTHQWALRQVACVYYIAAVDPTTQWAGQWLRSFNRWIGAVDPIPNRLTNACDMGYIREGTFSNKDVLHCKTYCIWDATSHGTFFHGSFRHLGLKALGHFIIFLFYAGTFCSWILHTEDWWIIALGHFIIVLSYAGTFCSCILLTEDRGGSFKEIELCRLSSACFCFCYRGLRVCLR